MIQLFALLTALWLAMADKPQIGTEMTAENGGVVVQSGDALLRAERLTFKLGKAECEFLAEGNRIIVRLDGLQIQAASMRYDPARGFLSCKGDAEKKARLSILRKGDWQLEKEAKTISYFIGGALGFED